MLGGGGNHTLQLIKVNALGVFFFNFLEHLKA